MEAINICPICNTGFDDNKCIFCCSCGKRVCNDCFNNLNKKECCFCRCKQIFEIGSIATTDNIKVDILQTEINKLKYLNIKQKYEINELKSKLIDAKRYKASFAILKKYCCQLCGDNELIKDIFRDRITIPNVENLSGNMDNVNYSSCKCGNLLCKDCNIKCIECNETYCLGICDYSDFDEIYELAQSMVNLLDESALDIKKECYCCSGCNQSNRIEKTYIKYLDLFASKYMKTKIEYIESININIEL